MDPLSQSRMEEILRLATTAKAIVKVVLLPIKTCKVLQIIRATIQFMRRAAILRARVVSMVLLLVCSRQTSSQMTTDIAVKRTRKYSNHYCKDTHP